MVLIIFQLHIVEMWNTDLTFKTQISDAPGPPFKLTEANNVASLLTKSILSAPLGVSFRDFG